MRGRDPPREVRVIIPSAIFCSEELSSSWSFTLLLHVNYTFKLPRLSFRLFSPVPFLPLPPVVLCPSSCRALPLHFYHRESLLITR
jgi:hypothetical protein